MVPAAGGPGPAGGGLLPDQPHDAAARPALRSVPGYRLPGHAASATAPGDRATPLPVVDVERLWIVDGTLVPVRDRTVAASSRNYRFSANVQVIIDADSRLMIASARPVPGNKADAHAWRESDLPAITAGTTVIADGAYLGTGLIVPHRRRAERPLLRGQEEDNTEHRRVRARVEHTFTRMKNWKILRDCRQKGNGLHHAVQAVATMHNLAMTG